MATWAPSNVAHNGKARGREQQRRWRNPWWWWIRGGKFISQARLFKKSANAASFEYSSHETKFAVHAWTTPRINQLPLVREILFDRLDTLSRRSAKKWLTWSTLPRKLTVWFRSLRSDFFLISRLTQSACSRFETISLFISCRMFQSKHDT
jgi:hypothetical protein